MKKPKNAEAPREEDARKPTTDAGWGDIDPMFLAGNVLPHPAEYVPQQVLIKKKP